jgi:hypothetical protein
MEIASSENATGAVNQQERLDPYIAGFVDGEGSFHVALQRNPTTRCGWQLVPEFRVSQDVSRIEVLEAIRDRLECGALRENHRASPNDRTIVFVVRRRSDLLEKVIPFFERNPLLSCKHQEFLVFADIVRRMATGEHLDGDGFERLAARALVMNGGGRYRRVHRSTEFRILRDHTPGTTPDLGEVKIWSDLHGDMQSQAEMPWPVALSAPSVTTMSVPIRCSRRRFEEGCP